MIQKVEMYQAVCDRCGKTMTSEAGDEYTAAFDSEGDAWDGAFGQGWSEIDFRLYCPDCVEYDKETKSYKPKEKEQ